MGTPYIGEIRMFGGNFAPAGWNFCNGALLSIAEFSALFSLIGTTYGGDGQNTFALPNLQSRVPLHRGNSLVQGAQGGEESVTLNVSQIPPHSHLASANAGGGTQTGPAGNVWAGSANNPYAAPNTIDTQMASNSIGIAGGGQPHDNMIPFLAINFIIALDGIFPSQG